MNFAMAVERDSSKKLYFKKSAMADPLKQEMMLTAARHFDKIPLKNSQL